MSALKATVLIPRKVWTREEAHALVDLGFPDAEKFELIAGDLIAPMGKKHLHLLWQHLIYEWLRAIFGPEFVRMESPTDVAPGDNQHNEPEPDLMVTTRSILEYDSLPTPEELRLIVEISDSTLQLDLTLKAALYARAGIVEYWVVNVKERRLVIHRLPVDGSYQSVANYAADEEVSSLAAPEARFCLERLENPQRRPLPG